MKKNSRVRTKKLVIGLTGTFGSGKSTVGRMLGKASVSKVIDCDEWVREIFSTENPIQKKIKRLFDIQGATDRKKIASIVFSDQNMRRRLEALIHPYVFRRMKEEIKAGEKGTIVFEIPLLFETGAERFCDATIAVYANLKSIMRRLRKKGFSVQEIKARQQAQFSQQEKKRKADFIINNSWEKEKLEKRVKRVWTKLISRDAFKSKRGV